MSKHAIAGNLFLLIFKGLALILCVALVYSLCMPILFTLIPTTLINANYHVGVFRYKFSGYSFKIQNPTGYYITLQGFFVISTISACLTSFFSVIDIFIEGLERVFFDGINIGALTISSETFKIPGFLYVSYATCFVFLFLSAFVGLN
ncbi:hypothetical protein MXB_3969 [Myxobolus squamalis]|nr:hypothetical protein MXB_3969 [Myxobolus squamalis]